MAVAATEAAAKPTARSTGYTYDEATGLVKTINGPRTVDGSTTYVDDVTTFEYDEENGNLQSVTNALGHQLSVPEHDVAGRPILLVDPNGLETRLTYHPRGWLSTRVVGGRTTRFEYDKMGQLKRLSLPDESFTEYKYDAAGHLTEVVDPVGNRIRYGVDSMGNRDSEEILDARGSVVYQLTRTFDPFNRLETTTDGIGHVSRYRHDAGGNVEEVVNARLHKTTQTPDALNRTTETKDALGGVTRIEYDALDQVVAVTDPRGNTTTYERNSLGDLLERHSPDTGKTTYLYDTAGNLETETDARGVAVRYEYDALNRPTLIEFPDPSLQTQFDYDDDRDGVNGIGRLTGITDASGTAEFRYDPYGNLRVDTRTVAGETQSVGYEYDAADRLVRINYPSGNTVSYPRDAGGRVTEVILNEDTPSEQIVAENIRYLPFGPLKALDFGNGLQLRLEFDRSYRLDRLQTGTAVAPGSIQDLDHDYDPNGNLTRIADLRDSRDTQTFTDGYDPLDRLKSAAGRYGERQYGYDANHNRTTLTVSDDTPPAFLPHRDIEGVREYVYNDANRLVTITVNGVVVGRYTYNAFGQRVLKEFNRTEFRYWYDQGGLLLAESEDGQVTREYVYLDGALIGYLIGAPTRALHFVHTTHLQTPVALTDQGGQVVWRATHAPFGHAVVEEDVDGDRTPTTMNVRFPGQYFDSESGLHYNYFRYYDSSTGRYLRSDPIGLEGGINTYAYAGGNPVSFVDPLGLNPLAAGGGVAGAGSSAFGIGGLAGSSGQPLAPMTLEQLGRELGDLASLSPVEIFLNDLQFMGASTLAVFATMCGSGACPECSPHPKGTIGYLGPHVDHDHFPVGRPHLNLFVVNQNPQNCECFWNKNAPEAVEPPPAPGWVNLNSGFPPLTP